MVVATEPPASRTCEDPTMRDDLDPHVAALVDRLELEPHPEGGYYRRTWEHPDTVDGRPLGSAILYLLGRGQRSHWHRIDAVELWHFYEGGPLELQLADGTGGREVHLLGADADAGHERQVAVPAGTWQAAVALGAYSLVGCTVTPAFLFEHHELAPPGWEPG